MFQLFSVTNALLFAISLLIGKFVYIIVIRSWNHFFERNVKFDRGVPGLGSLFPTLLGKMSMAESVDKLYYKFKNEKFFGFYAMGNTPHILIRDPELVKTITIKEFDSFVNHDFQVISDIDPLFGKSLFSIEDQKWREMRSILSPLFTGSKMRIMLSAMNEAAKNFTHYIRNEIDEKSPKKGIEYNMMDLLTCLVNDCIASCVFGLNINSLKDRNNDFYKAGVSIAYAFHTMRTFIIMAFPNVTKFFKVKIAKDEHNEFFRQVVRNNIKQRKEKGIVRNDMIHLLLLAQAGDLNEKKDQEDHQDTGFATVEEIIAAKSTEKLKSLTEDDFLGQCMLFFTAGFVGISSTLCFALHELAVSPDIQDRLYEEIVQTKTLLDGKELTFEAIQKMIYMDMVVTEVMRLWPVVVNKDRKVTKQYLLENSDGTKYLLQPNDVVWIPTFSLHRDPEYYPDPNKFDPERFNEENRINVHPGTYLPFGMGPRACIATRFALLALKANIFHILNEFIVECSEKTQVPLQMKKSGINLNAEKGFYLRLKNRS